MASSTRPCGIKKCETSSCAVCHCCQTDLCLDHLKEHKDQLNAKLIPLANQINTLQDSLEHFNPTSSASFIQLEQWRNAAHGTVDQFYQKLHGQLLEQTKNEPLEKLRGTRDTLEQLIRRQGATHENIVSLNNDLRLIAEKFNCLQKTSINLRPLVIDDNTLIQQDAHSKEQRCSQVNQPTGSVSPNDLQALQNGSAFQIFVQLPTGRQIFVAVKPSDTILDVKRKIEAKLQFPVEQLHLTYMGKSLQDDYNIALYGITRHSTLSAVFRPKPNPDQS